MLSFFKDRDYSAVDFPDYINVKRSKRAKRVGLRLDTTARRFDLIVPKRMSLARAQDFAISQERWMQDKLAELAPAILFADSVTIPVFGQDVLISIERDEAFKRTRVWLDDKYLRVQTNLQDPAPRIKRFLKQHAEEIMTPLVHKKAAQINKNVNQVRFRDTKSRWGSCSHDAKIMLSWRLIFAPYEAMDYVVAHEVAHLQHLDHSKSFWKVCMELSDDYKTGYGWMKSSAQELMSYGAA